MASSIEAAKQLACSEMAKWYAFGEYEKDAMPFAPADLGEPIRVSELPCAEWHYWAE